MKINFWQTSSGSSPVLKFIDEQEDKPASRIMKDIDHLEQQGLNLLTTKKMKHLTGYKQLYELITRFMGMGYRIIFTTIGNEAWLLEAFKKKSDDTPQGHIDNAVSRQRQLQMVPRKEQ